jgi:hypothetical protein
MMNKLTFRIQPNDEVTLKSQFRDIKHEVSKQDIMLFSGQTVVVCKTGVTHKVIKVEKTDILGTFYWIIIKDRSGHIIECPISFISKSHALRRNHKRYKLHNKTLICE